jgi:hypothetical protein
MIKLTYFRLLSKQFGIQKTEKIFRSNNLPDHSASSSEIAADQTTISVNYFGVLDFNKVSSKADAFVKAKKEVLEAGKELNLFNIGDKNRL